MSKIKDPRILDRIIDWARQRDDVRAAILTGSHAGRGATDEYSDYDVALFVTDQYRYANNHSWLDDIGDVWLCEKNTGRGEANTFPVHYRLTVFAPGTRVDFSIYAMHMLDVIVTDTPPAKANLYTLGYKVLLDKDGRTAGMAPPSTEPLTHAKPSEQEFWRVIEDFWHEAHNVAKYLARGDLWSAKSRDWQTKRNLLPMLEWNAHAKHGWDYDTAHIGKRMHEWIDPDIWRSLHTAFAHFDAGDSWDALFKTMTLFEKAAKETAKLLSYRYLEYEDKQITNLIKKMRQESKDGSNK